MDARATTTAVRKSLIAADVKASHLVSVRTRLDWAPSWSPLHGKQARVTVVETVTRHTADEVRDALASTYADVHVACGLNVFTVYVTQAA